MATDLPEMLKNIADGHTVGLYEFVATLRNAASEITALTASNEAMRQASEIYNTQIKCLQRNLAHAITHHQYEHRDCKHTVPHE